MYGVGPSSPSLGVGSLHGPHGKRRPAARSPSHSPTTAASVAALAAAAAAAAAGGIEVASTLKRSCTTPSLRPQDLHRRSKSHGGGAQFGFPHNDFKGKEAPPRYGPTAGASRVAGHVQDIPSHAGGSVAAGAPCVESQRVLPGRYSAPPTPRRLTRTPRLSPRTLFGSGGSATAVSIRPVSGCASTGHGNVHCVGGLFQAPHGQAEALAAPRNGDCNGQRQSLSRNHSGAFLPVNTSGSGTSMRGTPPQAPLCQQVGTPPVPHASNAASTTASPSHESSTISQSALEAAAAVAAANEAADSRIMKLIGRRSVLGSGLVSVTAEVQQRRRDRQQRAMPSKTPSCASSSTTLGDVRQQRPGNVDAVSTPAAKTACASPLQSAASTPTLPTSSVQSFEGSDLSRTGGLAKVSRRPAAPAAQPVHSAGPERSAGRAANAAGAGNADVCQAPRGEARSKGSPAGRGAACLSTAFMDPAAATAFGEGTSLGQPSVPSDEYEPVCSAMADAVDEGHRHHEASFQAPAPAGSPAAAYDRREEGVPLGAIVWPGRQAADLVEEAAPARAGTTAALSAAAAAAAAAAAVVAAPGSAWEWPGPAEQQRLQQDAQLQLQQQQQEQQRLHLQEQQLLMQQQLQVQQLQLLQQAGSLVAPHTWRFVPPPPQPAPLEEVAVDTSSLPSLAGPAAGLAKVAIDPLGAAAAGSSGPTSAAAKRQLLGDLVESLAARAFQTEQLLGGEQRANRALRVTLEVLQRQNLCFQQQLAYVTQSYQCVAMAAEASGNGLAAPGAGGG